MLEIATVIETIFFILYLIALNFKRYKISYFIDFFIRITCILIIIFIVFNGGGGGRFLGLYLFFLLCALEVVNYSHSKRL